jgi:hypothetical protein
MTTKIDATKHVRSGFPTDEGAALASALLDSEETDWTALEIDVRALPASLLISAFINAFLQKIADDSPERLDAARGIRWLCKFDFQTENLRLWVRQFAPVNE